MKFLNLNTGYSFDGLWKNRIDWENWKIEKRQLPSFNDLIYYINEHNLWSGEIAIEILKYKNLKDTDSFQIRFSSVESFTDSNKFPNSDGSTNNYWSDKFDPVRTTYIATRRKFSMKEDWEDWEIEKRNTPNLEYLIKYLNDHSMWPNNINTEIVKYNKLRDTDDFQIRFSSVEKFNDSNRFPNNDGSLNNYWSNRFDPGHTTYIATRSKISQTRGYIFWFPNEQSIDITYTMPICILTESDSPLNLHMEENDIFAFVKHTKETLVDDFAFYEPEYSEDIITSPEKISETSPYYAHLINVACTSSNAGEFICKITINEDSYIRIGADFYGEHEPAYINLSNFGVELPDGIQKSIYDSNVHEDLKDNILLNRKFKELLSNYWDVIANKGSYKSLINSLKWFEWDKILHLKEIWKHLETDKYYYDDREILTPLENKLKDEFTNFIKTSYVSIYCALQNELDEYDLEENPLLENAIYKWSKEDLQLKLALLSKFFGKYFMPINISLLHSTVEDKVFTNTIKTLYGSESSRDDFFGDFEYVETNIKENSSYVLSNVRAQVTDNTVFGVDYSNNFNGEFFGVDKFTSRGNVNEDNIKTFSTQYYAGPGVIIPIKMIIPNQSDKDYIQKTFVSYNFEDDKTRKLIFTDQLKVKQNKVEIDFNFLAKSAQNYKLYFTFIFASGKTVTSKIEFTVKDIDNVILNMYKVHAKDDSNGLTKADFEDKSICKYFYNIQKNYIAEIENEKPVYSAPQYYTQYLPYLTPDNKLYESYNGIKLNRIIVIDLKYDEVLGDYCEADYHPNADHYDHAIYYLRAEMYNTGDWLEYAKYENPGTNKERLKYLIYISNKFFISEAPRFIFENDYGYKYKVIRNDLGFFPQFHYLEKMKTTNNIEDFSLEPYEAFCCAVELTDGYVTKDFKYGHKIKDSEWTIENKSVIKNPDIIKYPVSIQSPFIAYNKKQVLSPGYYDISFKYSLQNGKTNEYPVKSSFIIKK